MIRVAVVTNYIPEYRCPVFQRVTELCDARLQFFTSSPLDASCELARQTLMIKHSRSINIHFRTNHKTAQTTQREQLPLPVGLLAGLIQFRPHVIIAGDMGLRSLLCWIAARLIRSRFVLWTEDIASSARDRSWLQKKLRRFLVTHTDAFLAWGRPAKEYLISLDAKAELIHVCQQAVDNDFWKRQSDALDRAALRRELSCHRPTFLLVGRLVERKGFRNFIQAWHNANAGLSHCMAIIVGNGDQLESLQRLVEQHKISNIRFAPSQSPQELAKYYAAADVFVFPSLEDVWGMVVNEALCFNLPILASKYAGASQGLIAEAMPECLFDPTNIAEFSEKLITMSTCYASENKRRGRSLLEDTTFEKSAQAIATLLHGISAHEDALENSSGINNQTSTKPLSP